ncbi:PREDICTED: uncharacterized protein LOC106814147 isoform X2 [Priapulus caudatus]|uniref:Uncharacterized protein LOC106814147 isoform X2 n=1 Tax=Priapulus caudatus TaxID=37621 RepID=A0ABM1EP04_PRICU|nr:PREDICTED: uncharacterized protein LOC106814147 isoform X2 [Priapulus caudatus]
MAEVLNSEFLELTRDEKEAFINRRVEMIRLKNENLKKRHEEIERDKQNAEQLSKLAPHRHSDEVRVSPPKQSAGIGRGRRLAERSKQAKELKSRQHEPKRREYERDRSPQQRDAQPPRHNHRYAPDTDDTGAPPPDPSFNFLADPGRHGGFRKHGGPTRQEGSRRHISNWGGTNFGNVKQNINRMKEREDYKSGRDGPKSKRELELSMTGRERQEYESWKAERDRVDLERLNRHERSGKREWDKEKVAIVDDVADKQKPQQEFQHRRGGPTQHRTGRVGSGRIVIKDGDSPARHRDVETDYGSSGVSQVDTKKDVQQHEVSHSRRRRKDEPHYASRNNDESRRTKARESGAAYPATHFKSVESPTPTGIDRSTPDQRNSDVRHASQVGKEDVWQSPPKGGSTLHAAVGSHWPSKVSMKMSEVVVTPSNASQPAEEVLDEEVDDGEVPQNTDRNIMTEEDQIVICISNNLVGKLTSREQRTAKNRERRLKARAKKASSRSSVSSSSFHNLCSGGELEEGRAGDPFDREERDSADEDVQGIQSDKVTKNQPSGKRADQGVECSRKLNGEPLEDDEDQWEDATNTSGSLDLSGRSEEPPCIEATAPQTPTTPQRMKTPEARVPVPDWAAAMESPRSSVGDSPQQYPAVGSDDTAQLYGEIVKAERGEAEANACVEGNPVTVATGLLTDEPAVVSGSEALSAQMPLGDSLKTGMPGANILETETPIAEVMGNCTPKSDAPETRMPQGNVLESGTPKGDVLEIEIHEGDDAETMASEGDAAETGAPECDVAETGAPEGDVAETGAPGGDAAETGAPESDAAETGAPESDAAETGAPESDVAECVAPESDSAETGAPECDAAETMASEGDVQQAGRPEGDVLKTDTPECEILETGSPTPLTCQSSGSGMSNATAIPTVCEGDSAPVQSASVPDVLPDAENYIAEAEVAGAQSEVDQHSRQTESAEA